MRRPWSDARLMGVGAVGGIFFLILCTVEPPRRHADAAPGAVVLRAPDSRATVPDEAVSAATAPQKTVLRARESDLLFPVPEVSPSAMADSFGERRGQRLHHAVDILAPRNSEVVAVADGSIARLMTSVGGGIAIYQWSSDRRLSFYYAHLQAYARDLFEGHQVKRGQVIGYVGTSGNAPPNTPHLHFGIARVEKENQWWGGTPVDPYPIWR